jgi:hypothetical protein
MVIRVWEHDDLAAAAEHIATKVYSRNRFGRVRLSGG